MPQDCDDGAGECSGSGSGDLADPDHGRATAGLEAAGITAEELAVCISVLQRLDSARDHVDWRASELRALRKALVPHLGEAFGKLPQKSTLDARERVKEEKNRKRERRQRQVEADKRWQNNAQLRASRLAQLEALEGPAAVAALKDAADAEVAEAAEAAQDPDGAAAFVPPQRTAPLRVPDGPVVEAWEATDAALDGQEAAAAAASDYARQQACYTCKARFVERHHFYSHLCPVCAHLNFNKRQQRCDMTGRVCLVTGARVKIGFQTVLKLLRMGARVIATTRFPEDARRRYIAEQDAPQWLGRLQLCGVDFRFLGAVERLCDDLLASEAWLDVIVNNACQTIRRPAGYYGHLLEIEAAARTQALADGGGAANAGGSCGSGPGAAAVVLTSEGRPAEFGGDSVAMSQLQVLAEDAMSAEDVASVLPLGERDVHGQQLDLRSTNSWLLKLGQVSTPEAVEVFCINALTPFTINGRLRPLLERSPHPDRYVVNVSAMEGKFYRYKQPTHPHTNMAKAALNMMTRTSAEDFARSSGIYMNSVDTGWINDENPLPTAQRIAEDHGFQTPIDEVDAAARILDPVVTGVAAVASGVPGELRRLRKGAGGAGGGGGGPDGSEPAWGRFFKDYAATEW